jgi:putative OPT family oligopeptide transporter
MSIFDRLFKAPLKDWEKDYKELDRRPRAKQESVTIVAEHQEAPSTSSFQPYVPSRVRMRELTLLPVIVGTILGVIFGASSLYLVLKVGLTVSASIPVAVISITLFRILSKLGAAKTTILENNIVQTAGSAGESIAFGVGVTMPAILILGFDLEIGRVMLVSVLGGLLGILMMIPLRRALIVEQHGLLKYPEGTACAEVLKAGASTEDRLASRGIEPDSAVTEEVVLEKDNSATTIFTGFAIGLVYKALNVAFHAWKEVSEKVFKAPIDAASVSAEISPELLGVGYIIGPKISAIMCGGGALAYLLLIPLIKHFGANYPNIFPPALIPLSQMGPGQIRGAYILYIGAGAVTAGGIISLLRSIPTIWSGIKEGMKDLPWRQKAGVAGNRARVDDDLPTQFVLGGILALIAMIMLSPSLNLFLNPLGAILIVIFGFLFVTVSSRLTGEVGSSSNPISGMTVATVLFTCLIFVLIGWTGPSYFVTALSIGGIVCIASSNGGTVSQDLKTGFLIGATPRKQQVAILIGALASALALGPILLRLNDAATVYVPGTDFEAVKDRFAIDYTKLEAYHGLIKPPTGQDYHVLHLVNKEFTLEPGDYMVNPYGVVTWKMHQNFPSALRAPTKEIDGTKEALRGVDALQDSSTYRVWHKPDDVLGPAGKYLVDADGNAVYLVDPGINGTHKYRSDGTSVTKFDAPKATLISYIIKGVLSQKLPWGMVMIGVGIAVLTELCGISSLTFAVGVYLPLSTTTPILMGGMIRWAIDKFLRARWKGEKRTEEDMVAESDRSPGVLMASGYIAGGAIAGVLIAFMAGVLSGFDKSLTDWSQKYNPFFAGPWSDALALIPFAILCWLLYLVGKEKWLAPKQQ